MKKPKVLIAAHILFSLMTAFGLLSSQYSIFSFSSFEEFFQAYGTNIVFLLILIANILPIFKLLRKQKKVLPQLQSLIIFSSVLWLLLFFLSYFLASSIIFPFICLAVIYLIFRYFWKSSKNSALFFIALTVVVSVLVIGDSFEEDYCVNKGTAADISGSQEVPASRDDVFALSTFDLTEGQMIRVSFRTHMLCHTTFRFSQALRETYLFQ